LNFFFAERRLPTDPDGPESRVPPEDDLRRAIRTEELDDEGNVTSAPFQTANMSMDVASLATLAETQRRFPESFIGVVGCSLFNELQYFPVFNPLPDNAAHALLREKMSKSSARKVAKGLKSLHPPVS
jgi:hypothetical protein